MDEIYKTYLSKIYRYVLYLVGDSDRAEDITQETFIKTWQFLPDFSKEKGTIQAILYRIARNLVIDYQRKKKMVSLESAGGESIADSVNLVDDLADKDEMAEIRSTLLFLPKEDRELVVLRYFEDLSYKEVAEVSGSSEGAVRIRVHRALKTLKNELSKRVKN